MKLLSLTDIDEEGVSHDPEIKKRVMLRRGFVPHLTNFAQSTLLPGQTARSHTHADMHEIFFVEAGAGVIRINDRQHELRRGVCVAVEPGEVHEITNTGASELVLLYFGIEV